MARAAVLLLLLASFHAVSGQGFPYTGNIFSIVPCDTSVTGGGLQCICPLGFCGDGTALGSGCVPCNTAGCSEQQGLNCNNNGFCESTSVNPEDYQCGCPAGFCGDGYNVGSGCLPCLLEPCSEDELSKCHGQASCAAWNPIAIPPFTAIGPSNLGIDNVGDFQCGMEGGLTVGQWYSITMTVPSGTDSWLVEVMGVNVTWMVPQERALKVGAEICKSKASSPLDRAQLDYADDGTGVIVSTNKVRINEPGLAAFRAIYAFHYDLMVAGSPAVFTPTCTFPVSPPPPGRNFGCPNCTNWHANHPGAVYSELN